MIVGLHEKAVTSATKAHPDSHRTDAALSPRQAFQTIFVPSE
jgi:hypothetical protein